MSDTTAVESEYLDTEQLAALLQTTPTAIRRRVYRGVIPPQCIIQGRKGGRLLFVRRLVKKHLLTPTGRAH